MPDATLTPQDCLRALAEAPAIRELLETLVAFVGDKSEEGNNCTLSLLPRGEVTEFHGMQARLEGDQGIVVLRLWPKGGTPE